MAQPIKSSEEVRGVLKTNAPLAEFAMGQNLGLQFVALAEVKPFTDADLAPRANQAFPLVGIGRNLTR